MVERPIAAAEPRCASDRLLDVEARAVHGGLDAETLGETGCDRRGEGAAGAVSVAGRDPRALPYPDAARRDEDIRLATTN